MLDVNPAYGEGIRFADKTIKAGNDAEYGNCGYSIQTNKNN